MHTIRKTHKREGLHLGSPWKRVSKNNNQHVLRVYITRAMGANQNYCGSKTVSYMKEHVRRTEVQSRTQISLTFGENIW